MDWHTWSFHFEKSKHEAFECETFIKNMFGGVHDRTCHAVEKKYEDICM
jgi:hypothetical protein